MYRFIIPTFAFSLFLVCISAFKLSYNYQNIHKTHRILLSEIKQTQENIHHLKTEWSYLNSPQQLATISKQYLPKLKEIPYELAPTISVKKIAFRDDYTPPLTKNKSIQTAQK